MEDPLPEAAASILSHFTVALILAGCFGLPCCALTLETCLFLCRRHDRPPVDERTPEERRDADFQGLKTTSLPGPFLDDACSLEKKQNETHRIPEVEDIPGDADSQLHCLPPSVQMMKSFKWLEEHGMLAKAEGQALTIENSDLHTKGACWRKATPDDALHEGWANEIEAEDFGPNETPRETRSSCQAECCSLSSGSSFDSHLTADEEKRESGPRKTGCHPTQLHIMALATPPRPSVPRRCEIPDNVTVRLDGEHLRPSDTPFLIF